MKVNITKILSGFLLLFMVACNSPEFTSLKMYVQEGNLSKAEENGLKALQVEPQNALVPYVLAVDVYLKQKKYEKMAEMFDEAMKRNPDQKLESPIVYEDKLISTVGQAVEIYREQEWSSAFNNGVQAYSDKNMDKAIEAFQLASKIDPAKGRTYGTLAAVYIEMDDLTQAKSLIDKALQLDPADGQALITAGNIAGINGDKQQAINYYLKAAELSSKPAPIMKKLIFLYIDLDEYQQAIDYSMKVLKSNPYDSDIYYNIGVLYQRLALNDFNQGRDRFNEVSGMEVRDQAALQGIYDNFKKARILTVQAREYFQQALDLETADTGAGEAVGEMKKLKEQMDLIFIPAVESMMK